MKPNNYQFHLFTLAVVLLFLLPQVFQEGLFMDGLIYSTISHNMANGIGSFFYPSFSQTIMPIFNEHPPLVFGIQSVFFKVFGDAFYIEKSYSFISAILTMVMISLLWKKLAPSKSIGQLYWLPILLWIIVPTIPWSFNNNMLENTMGLFSLIAIYLLLISNEKKGLASLFNLFLGSLFIFLAFLSKGFPSLYPLAFFFIYFILFRERISFKKAFLSTLLSFVIVSSLFLLYLYSSSDALNNFNAYFNSQVLSSIEGKRELSSRWDLFSNLSRELIVPLLLIALIYFGNAFISKIKIYQDRTLNKAILFCLFMALASSLPLLVSPKQLSFYIVPSVTFFALAMGFFISPILLEYQNRINDKSWGYKVFNYFNKALFMIVLVITITNFGSYSRDKEMIQDIDKIAKIVNQDQVITISESLHGNWALIGQFQRKYFINIDINKQMEAYLLIPKSEDPVLGYEIQEIDLSLYTLLKKGN